MCCNIIWKSFFFLSEENISWWNRRNPIKVFSKFFLFLIKNISESGINISVLGTGSLLVSYWTCHATILDAFWTLPSDQWNEKWNWNIWEPDPSWRQTGCFPISFLYPINHNKIFSSRPGNFLVISVENFSTIQHLENTMKVPFV